MFELRVNSKLRGGYWETKGGVESYGCKVRGRKMIPQPKGGVRVMARDAWEGKV